MNAVINQESETIDIKGKEVGEETPEVEAPNDKTPETPAPIDVESETEDAGAKH